MWGFYCSDQEQGNQKGGATLKPWMDSLPKKEVNPEIGMMENNSEDLSFFESLGSNHTWN